MNNHKTIPEEPNYPAGLFVVIEGRRLASISYHARIRPPPPRLSCQGSEVWRDGVRIWQGGSCSPSATPAVEPMGRQRGENNAHRTEVPAERLRSQDTASSLGGPATEKPTLEAGRSQRFAREAANFPHAVASERVSAHSVRTDSRGILDQSV